MTVLPPFETPASNRSLLSKHRLSFYKSLLACGDIRSGMSSRTCSAVIDS
jgi:hypothetical protein